MRTLNTVAVAGGLLALAALPPAARAQEPFPALDAYVNKAIATWKVPGLSIAIVRHDSVIYTKGYGVLATGGTQAVNDQTLFEIGSSSKAFTSTIVAMLVTDGKMRYDAHLSEYLPGFTLYDPVANANVTVRDALTHRSGIARGELVWLGAGISRDEVLHRIRFLKPETPFRSHYSYQNMMFLAAGQAAGRAAGTTWDELVKQRIFEPLGMTSSVTDYHAAGPNAAKPHGAVKDSVFAEPFMNGNNIAPAGAIMSNAHDMAQWLRFQLADGVHDGKRLVGSAPFRETHTPQILMTGAPEAGMRPATGDTVPVTHFSTYGMGWIIEDYHNHLMWQHGGNTIGMTAAVGMLPEDKFGVAVLSNMGAAQLPAIIMHYIFDHQIGAPVHDLSAEAYARYLTQRRRADSAEVAQAGEPHHAEPPLAISAFAGTYADSLYGEATVTLENGKLMLQRGEWRGALEFMNGMTFRWMLTGISPTGPMPIKFDASPDGKVTGMYFGLGADATLLGRKNTGESGRGRGRSPQ